MASQFGSDRHAVAGETLTQSSVALVESVKGSSEFPVEPRKLVPRNTVYVDEPSLNVGVLRPAKRVAFAATGHASASDEFSLLLVNVVAARADAATATSIPWPTRHTRGDGDSTSDADDDSRAAVWDDYGWFAFSSAL